MNRGLSNCTSGSDKPLYQQAISRKLNVRCLDFYIESVRSFGKELTLLIRFMKFSKYWIINAIMKIIPSIAPLSVKFLSFILLSDINSTDNEWRLLKKKPACEWYIGVWKFWLEVKGSKN